MAARSTADPAPAAQKDRWLIAFGCATALSVVVVFLVRDLTTEAFGLTELLILIGALTVLIAPAVGRPIPSWARRALIGAVALGAVVVAAASIVLELSPGVADAENRIRALDAVHGVADPGIAPPARVATALIATEDTHFRIERGIDPVGALRATVGSWVGGGDQGGATLDQQLAKLVFTGGHHAAGDQLTQVALGWKLDHRYTKTQILEMYLQAAYFGHGYWGINAAAAGYFARTPDQLAWPQAAVLAGLVQAPSAYDPYQHPALALARRSHVLDRLVATGALNRHQADVYATAPLALARR
ncbi:biosynthetic peptidoglycan transglycosylase [Pseudofrankia sp. DC12]|uniref:biosynthetic peptidoglycan transglycosylase n=1 Tax=Pseudofrankia sp. DC12 TaxID=683315 RepID=UPI0005F816B0|nr:biosynthetic peptidoglycan transglycosylase [Pseudofrankia sp. DC12]